MAFKIPKTRGSSLSCHTTEMKGIIDFSAGCILPVEGVCRHAVAPSRNTELASVNSILAVPEGDGTLFHVQGSVFSILVMVLG